MTTTTTDSSGASDTSGQQLLADEIAYYKTHKKKLMREHRERYLLIKGSALIGSYDSEDEAVAEGIRQFDSEPFLVRLAGEDTPILSVPLLSIGMITLCQS